jgi:hypothetical protein
VSHNRLNPDFSAVHLDDAFRDREPQPGAALLARDRIVGLLKFLKQLSLISFANARPGVVDCDSKRALGRGAFD